MPSFCKPYALRSTQFVDARPHGEYDYKPMRAAINRIRLYCGKNRHRFTAMRDALLQIGQHSVDHQLGGRLAYRDAEEVLGQYVGRKAVNRQLFWLGDCGLITEEPNARYFRINDYARKNRTLDQWREVKVQQRAYWRSKKRQQRVLKHASSWPHGGLEMVPEKPNSAFVPLSVKASKNLPPTPHSTPTPSLTGGVGQITKQQAPPPDPKPAGQDRAQNAGLEPMDVQGALSRLFAPAKPTSEAHPKALRQVFDAAPQPAQQVENDSQDNDEVFPDWCDPAKFRALSRARHGREVTEAYATEQLTPKSRPEVLKLERVPITPDELDAICAVPEPKRTQLLAGNYTRAEVKRVYEHAANDPDCRMPNRVLLSRLQSGQGRRSFHAR